MGLHPHHPLRSKASIEPEEVPISFFFLRNNEAQLPANSSHHLVLTTSHVDDQAIVLPFLVSLRILVPTVRGGGGVCGLLVSVISLLTLEHVVDVSPVEDLTRRVYFCLTVRIICLV